MFGWSSGVIVFTLLNLSLGRIADRENEILSILLGAAGLGLSCLVLGKRHQYIPVELTCSGQTVTLTALRDTGNTLRDPITGRQVLIVDADIAKKLLENEGLPITEIASKLNYSTIYVFSRAFKNKFGISPKEFRNSILQKKAETIGE